MSVHPRELLRVYIERAADGVVDFQDFRKLLDSRRFLREESPEEIRILWNVVSAWTPPRSSPILVDETHLDAHTSTGAMKRGHGVRLRVG